MFNIFKKKPIDSIQVDSSDMSQNNPDRKVEITEISIRYSYEWKEDVPMDERDTENFESRPFCKMLNSLGRVYSRSDIETMSARLGYSVWDRCGGLDCRHRWVRVVITKKLKEPTILVSPR